MKESDLLKPVQQTKTAMKLKVATDLYLQKFKKFEKVGIFHWYSELLYAALLESDPEVTCFTPQPMQVRILGKKYIPDFHYIKNNKSFIVELKPGGNFDEEKKLKCEELFSLQHMKFEVISNEYVFDQEIKALNWLQVVRVIISSTKESTNNQELKLLSDVASGSVSSFGDVIDVGDRFATKLEEIAMYRLIHKGKLWADLDKQLIDLDTRVDICH